MANENPGVWGIDLGQCALKALRLENIEGQVVATAFDYVEHPKILSQPDADPDQLTREALEKFLSRNDIKGDTVAISIPGQSGLARFVKLPPVEEKKISDIVRFEAKQQIPFNLDEVVWDYQKIGSGVVADGFAMDTEIGLFAIKKDTVHRAMQQFKDVNVEVHLVQMAPLALCNFVSFDLLGKTGAGEGETGKKDCIVALDIGTDNSNLVITDGSRIIWQRPIPIGGNHFTRAITKDMKLTFAKAEHLKRNASKSPDLKKILASLKPVLNDFVGEVQRSLGYFTNTHRDATVQYMMGLGSAFRLPGLQKFLAEKLQMDVQRLAKLQRLTGDPVITAPVFTENLLSFAVAYGLAVQGLKLTQLQTNLLPPEIRTERLIRAKKPWAVSAAAALLLGTSALAFGYAMQHKAVASDSVQDALKFGKSITDKAAKFKGEYDRVEKQIEEDKVAVRSIVAGQDERLNWIHLNRFINDALPLPDASNLDKVAKETYWDKNPFAEKAHKAWIQRQLAKLKLGEAKTDDEEGIKDLIGVNVQSVFCMYSEDLSTFPAKMKAMADFETMSPEDQKKNPAGKGWVVELRGFTYHKGGRNFLIQTLLSNLSRQAKRTSAPQQTEVAQDPSAPPGGAPAAGDAAAAAPAGGAAAATADASSSEPPPEDKPEDTKDPVGNRVSHVVLFQYHQDPDPQPNNYYIIGSSVVSSVVSGGAGGIGGGPGAMGGGSPGGSMPGDGGDTGGGMGGKGGGMMSPGGMMGGAASGLSSWSPLSSGSTGGMLGGGMGGSPGEGGGMGMRGSGGGGPMVGGPMGTGTGTGSGSRMMSPPGGGMMPGGGGMGGRSLGTGGTGMGGRMPGMGMRGAGMGPDAGMGGDAAMQAKLKKARQVRTEFIVLFLWREPIPSDKFLSAPEADATATGGSMGGPGS